jgi:hypothetical protein
MPRQLTKSDIESGLARVIREAIPKAIPATEPPPTPAPDPGPDVADVLKEVAEAIKRMVALHASTVAMLKKPTTIPPADNSEILERMAEIQLLTQQAMENMSMAIAESRKDVTTLHTPVVKDIELSVTERDAWGRIVKLKAHVEAK